MRFEDTILSVLLRLFKWGQGFKEAICFTFQESNALGFFVGSGGGIDAPQLLKHGGWCLKTWLFWRRAVVNQWLIWDQSIVFSQSWRPLTRMCSEWSNDDYTFADSALSLQWPLLLCKYKYIAHHHWMRSSQQSSISTDRFSTPHHSRRSIHPSKIMCKTILLKSIYIQQWPWHPTTLTTLTQSSY